MKEYVLTLEMQKELNLLTKEQKRKIWLDNQIKELKSLKGNEQIKFLLRLLISLAKCRTYSLTNPQKSKSKTIWYKGGKSLRWRDIPVALRDRFRGTPIEMDSVSKLLTTYGIPNQRKTIYFKHDTIRFNKVVTEITWEDAVILAPGIRQNL